MSSVMFPAIAGVRDEPARVRAGFLLATRLTAMIAAPSMMIVAVVAPHLVSCLYGPQWSGAVVPLQIFSVAGYFRALYHLGGVVAQAVGRVYGELWRQLAYAALVVGGTLLGSRQGLPGVAIGVSVAILFMFVATGHLVLQATGTKWRAYLRVQREALAIAAIAGAMAWMVRRMLEAHQASSLTITFAVLIAAAVPWSAGMLSTLADPQFAPLLASAPRWLVRLAGSERISGSRSRG
jgi:PST family polysaccharide transporter